MAEQILQIRSFLDGLGRRERRLLLGRALLQLLGAVLFVSVAAALVLSLGGTRAAVVGWVGGMGGLLGWFAFAWPLVPRWSAARDPRRQARLVEGEAPDLRSRLLTVVDRPAAEPGVSGALLARAVARVSERISGIRPAAVHSARPVGKAGLLVVVAALLTLGASILLPVGPGEAWQVVFGASAASARMGDEALDLAEEPTLVGDIVLRYIFPDYTGIEPIEVPNSDGTIHAPPGTRVQITARTERAFDAAAFQIEGQEPKDAVLTDGRDLSATMVVDQDGVWRFLLFEGRSAVRSQDYKIVAEADAAPVVTILRGPSKATPVDSPLDLFWSAQDDYGVGKVVLSVTQGEENWEVELRAPLDSTTGVQGAIRSTPRQLGLLPGQDATLQVVAVDNDPVAGGKRGASSAQTIHVTGPRGGGERLAQYHERLRDAMVLTLADFLEEPMPPATSAEGMNRWVGKARKRLDPIREVVEEQWGDEVPDGVDGTLVDRVMEGAAVLFRFALTAWDPSSSARASEQDLTTFASLDGEVVEGLEIGIFVLDGLLRQAALSQLAEEAQKIARNADALADLAPDAESAELLARLDQLKRLMQDLAKTAERLSEGELKEFINRRAEEAKSLMDEIRKAIAEGRLDDAREMMKMLADSLNQMSDSLSQQAGQQQQGEDAVKQAYEEAQEQLAKLEADQRALAEQLQEARSKGGEQVDQWMKDWEMLDRLMESVANGVALGSKATGDGAGWRSGTLRRFDQLTAGAPGLESAIHGRDAERALERLAELERQAFNAGRAVEYEQERGRPSSEPLPEGIGRAEAATDGVERDLATMRPLLEELARQRPKEDPALKQLAKKLSQQQGELTQRQQALEQDVKKLEQAMPTGDGKATEQMQQAGEAMDGAGRELGEGRASGGQGLQQEAADRLNGVQQTLKQQMDELKQMQQAQQQMSQGERGQKGEKGGDGQEGHGQQVEIPAPEDFQTPEAYRRALLEGMSGDVPEEYRPLSRRYYEELVRQ